MRRERDRYDIVILPFDLEDNDMKKYWAPWMLHDDFETDAIFDFRPASKIQLWTEFGIRSYFKKELDLVDDRPRLVACEELANDPTD